MSYVVLHWLPLAVIGLALWALLTPMGMERGNYRRLRRAASPTARGEIRRGAQARTENRDEAFGAALLSRPYDNSFGGRYGQGRGGDTFPLHPSFTNREVPGAPVALASSADTRPASASPTARCEATGVGRTAPVAPTKRPT